MGNGQFKLYFPSHAMPFIIPISEIPQIVTKINLLLTDMENKGVTKAGGFTIPATGGGQILIDMPTPGDWILVDTYYSTVIHEAFAAKMIRINGTYMVLPLKAAGLKAADLKAACDRASSGPPPGYSA